MSHEGDSWRDVMNRGVFKTAYGKARQSAEALLDEGGARLTFLLASVLVTLVVAIISTMNSFAQITEDSVTNATQSYKVLIEKQAHEEQEASLPALRDESSTTTVTTRSESSSTNISSTSSSDTKAEVVVNGQSVKVPEQGSTKTDIKTEDGTMQVEISVDSESTSVSSVDSSIDIDISSSSEIKTEGGE